MNSPKTETGESLNYLNVGTGLEISIKNLATIISKIIGFKGEIKWDISKKDGTPRKLLNVRNINQLGWKAKINLEDGLKSTIDKFINDFEINNFRK